MPKAGSSQGRPRAEIFMMCQRIGLPPTSTLGVGRSCDSSLIREPCPPPRITHCMPGLYHSDFEEQARAILCQPVGTCIYEEAIELLQRRVARRPCATAAVI